MQQSELRERIEGRGVDFVAADYLANLPYNEFIQQWILLGGAEYPTLGFAAMLRVIDANYAREDLKKHSATDERPLSASELRGM